MDTIDLAAFMTKRTLTDNSDGFKNTSDHINALTTQLPFGFGDDAHKTPYLRRAVMRMNWAEQPILMVNSSRFTFMQFLAALQESLHINE